ncbi:MAG TPA: glycosyltransferase [Planctomycetota bacterium]|nr:glycosyltransferase [Planctomycetota bacterium]
MAPRVDVVVVSVFDDPRLRTCLDALRAQRDATLHVVVIENGAGPVPVDLGEAAGAVATLTRRRRVENPGFCAAFDEGFDAGDAPYVLSVNPDATLRPYAVAAACAAAAADPNVGAVAFRLTRSDAVLLDSAGVVEHPAWWRASDRGGGRPAQGAFLDAADVDAPCLAAALLVRRAVDAARDGAGEVLDARYFAYQDDVDLGRRLRRAGFRVRYQPTADGAHERGWKEGRRREIPLALRRLSLRNRLWTIAKNASAGGLLLRLPALLLYEAARFAYLLVREPGVLPAYVDALRGLPATLRRRPLRGTR